MATNTYESPLNSRYASKEMQYIFSPDKKFTTWRKLWIALAESEKELGLDITDKQIAQMKEHIYDINYDVAKAREKEVRHDVMSHVYAYGVQCPDAKPIIHLGATSCYVGDNTDIIIMTEAMQLVKKKLVCLIGELAKFAKEYKDLPTLAFTHFQPAQPTTVGKRASLWLEDLLMDLEDVDYQLSKAKLLGCKGTTGTQASFLELFEGDHEKCKMLDKKIAEKMGYEESFPVSGQTYPRKLDSQMLNTLSLIAQSAYKFSNDIRLLQHLKQIEEPFEKSQIGSSAMAYKRNPMRSERIGSLARYVIVDALNPAITASTQWFERTLDDSANKRISVPEAFLAVDAILSLYINVVDGLVVYDKVINQQFMREIPFMATENIMMAAILAPGITVIENAAEEPEIWDLARFLNSMGAKIEGAGYGKITIHGVSQLKQPEQFTPIFDRIEAGTFMVAAGITNSKITINGVNEEHLMPTIEKLKECGVYCSIDGQKMIVDGTQEKKPVDIKTMPYPGFPTDMQAQIMALLSITRGVSVITETVFENRFMHVGELGRMGANIKIDGRIAIVEGVSTLTGCEVKATDLRAGAAMILAGLVANGETEIGEVYHIDRGYTNIEEKFKKLGAEIYRIHK